MLTDRRTGTGSAESVPAVDIVPGHGRERDA